MIFEIVSGRDLRTRNITFRDSTVYDLVVVGGGIVGVTTARAMLIEKPDFKVAVLEKESDVAVHQSSHNSGVIHAGIYYKPDSLKAKLCVAGLRKTYEFCDEHDIPYRKCGKLVIATNEVEVVNLKRIFRTALANKAPDVEFIGFKKMKEIEPHCQVWFSSNCTSLSLYVRELYRNYRNFRRDWARFTRLIRG